MRLFIAIDFPKTVKEEIIKSIKDLILEYPQVSWVKTENIHLTLKFLGNVPDGRLPELKKAITESLKNIPPFKLSFTEFGYFDKGYLVVWLGVNPRKELLDLAGSIEKGIRRLDFPSEKRPYSPHVTLGRGKQLTKVQTLQITDKIKVLNSSVFTSLTVSEIILIQSVLKSSGAEYSPIAKFALF